MWLWLLKKICVGGKNEFADGSGAQVVFCVYGDGVLKFCVRALLLRFDVSNKFVIVLKGSKSPGHIANNKTRYMYKIEKSVH